MQRGMLEIRSESALNKIPLRLNGKFKSTLDELVKKSIHFVNIYAFEDLVYCVFMLEHLNPQGGIETVECINLTEYLKQRT
jgi:hypothetical protein